MSANIYWRPIKEGRRVTTLTPSAFINALQLPARFTEGDLPFLRGVLRGRPDWEKAIEELFDAIEKYGEIEVYAQY